MDMQAEIDRLQGEVRALERQLTQLRAEAAQQVAEVHRSYRRDIVLRSQSLPVVRPDGTGRG
jgi:hypothetical protein